MCKLHKAIYGLKHAPRAWFDTFASTLIQMGFYKSREDNSFFLKFSSSSTIYLLISIDDRSLRTYLSIQHYI